MDAAERRRTTFCYCSTRSCRSLEDAVPPRARLRLAHTSAKVLTRVLLRRNLPSETIICCQQCRMPSTKLRFLSCKQELITLIIHLL